VIGATNASESVLDQALLRPGRLDRKIYVDRPGLEDREKLYSFYLSKVKADASIDIARLARRTVWKTPADIENIILVGGGAHLFMPAIKEHFPNHEIAMADDPVFANVRGFHVAGEIFSRRNAA